MSGENHTIQERVLGDIAAGKVKMRPKSYFIAHTALIFSVMALIVFVSIYLASFSVFILRNNGAWFVPVFGPSGIIEFFISIPWLLVICLAASIALLEIIMRKHTISYRKPLLYSLGGVFLVVCAVGVYVGQTSFHQSLLARAHGPGLPFVGSAYREYCSRKMENVHQGMVVSLQEHGFCIHDSAGSLIAFITNPATKVLRTKTMVEGDRVVVFSKQEKKEVARALGIRKMGHEQKEVRKMADATIKEVAEKCAGLLHAQP